MTIIICTICKRERPHHTRGLCNACACWARSQGMLQLFAPRSARAGWEPRPRRVLARLQER